MGKVIRFERQGRRSQEVARRSVGKKAAPGRIADPRVRSSICIWAGLAVASVAAVLLSGGPPSSCDIKGNISMRTGERIYHVPGQDYYDETRVSPGHGERWFCSEAEARRAGWRRALR